jgi:phosphate transport system substrate-binding protein
VAVHGSLAIPCADALSDLGDDWDRGFRSFQPGAGLDFHYTLSKEAIHAFTGGTTALIISSRDLVPGELGAFQERFGYPPVRIPICMDANIVFVNKDNPITAISMEQLDAIYSKNRLGGASAPAQVWGDLGVKGDLAKRIIHAYSRPEGIVTRTSFGTLVLLGGEFREGIIDREDSAGLADAVTADAAGIAFGSLTSWFATTKTLPVVPYHATEARYPNDELYPMRRLFYAFLNRPPGKPLDSLVNEALRFLLSQEGQNQVADVGLLPGPEAFITAGIKHLDR